MLLTWCNWNIVLGHIYMTNVVMSSSLNTQQQPKLFLRLWKPSGEFQT